MLFTGIDVRSVSKVEVSVDSIEFKLLEEEERERTIPTVVFEYGFLTQENADTFPTLMSRQQVWSNRSDML